MYNGIFLGPLNIQKIVDIFKFFWIVMREKTLPQQQFWALKGLFHQLFYY